jgi:predicted kinase
VKIVVAVGLPGSGKSTYFRKLGVNAISSDSLRLQLADDETDQTIHAKVFAAMRYLLRERLELKRPVTHIDATNLTIADRRQWFIEGCEAEALFFDIPLAVCKERNSQRHRIVPPEVLDMMYAKLQPPTIAEGFRRVEVVKYPPEKHPAGSAN